MRNTADVTGKPIAVLLHSISGVSAINPLVAFYDIHGGKREDSFILSRAPNETCAFKVCLLYLWYKGHGRLTSKDVVAVKGLTDYFPSRCVTYLVGR
jgi:hypothetical protein